MTPTTFPQANTVFGPPPGMDESQVKSVHAYLGEVKKGSCDGSRLVVVAWEPTPEEREHIACGGRIYLTVLGQLPPHMLTTRFEHAINPL